MNTYLRGSFLFVSGLVMIAVGFYIGLLPNSYFAAINMKTVSMENISELNTTISPNVLSDLRGMGGMLLIFGVIVFLSTFFRSWQHTSMIVATTVYVSFVLFRLLGFIIDGLPAFQIMLAFYTEMALAVAGIIIILLNKRKEHC